MQTLTLNEIEAAVRASWGPQTAYASAAYTARGREHPSRDQCGTTALVVQDLLGGDLVVTDVQCEGRVEGVHHWNAMPGGVELDLTRDQSTTGEYLVHPRRITTRRSSSRVTGVPPGLVPHRPRGAGRRVGPGERPRGGGRRGQPWTGVCVSTRLLFLHRRGAGRLPAVCATAP